MKHTAGPWVVKNNRTLIGANGDPVIHNFPAQMETGVPGEQGNISLVKAAPDLLKALQNIERWNLSESHPLYKQGQISKIGKQAIAKATKE